MRAKSKFLLSLLTLLFCFSATSCVVQKHHHHPHPHPHRHHHKEVPPGHAKKMHGEKSARLDAPGHHKAEHPHK